MPSAPQDNGWRFFSEIDDEEYWGNPDNLQVVSFTNVAEIEPAVLPILNFPVGTDLELIKDDAGSHLIDSATGRELFPRRLR